jgi:hypothetical protein
VTAKTEDQSARLLDSYLSGSVVTLSATAASGSVFNGWSVNGSVSVCGTSPTCTVTVVADASVTATFGPAPATFNLTTVRVGSERHCDQRDGKINCGASAGLLRQTTAS